jgi:hypothetical protein
MRVAEILAFFVVCGGSALGVAQSAESSPDIIKENSVWDLPGTATENRWVEVHSIESIGAATVYHVSVLSRRKGEPVWSLKHLVPHMAITEEALRRSVVKLSRSQHTAYPETYDGGYNQWRALRNKGTVPICDTSLLECAKP